MTVIASLITSLGLESSSFASGLKEAQKQLKATQKQFASIGDNMTKVGAVLTVGITAPFTALVSSAIPAAVESQQAMAQVTAALTSMGPAAGRTAEQLSDLASKLQDTSNFDDDDIMKSVTANLLTFGKVQGEVFDRAEQAVVDISARMGTDLQSAAIMVGKALNDPLKGLKALGRAGIQFTAEQQEAIKSMVAAGNAAGAQKIMLGELERQFGGAAQAQRDATPTAAQDQAWRTFQENVGGVALKVMPAVTSALTGILGAFNELSPSVQTSVVTVAALAAGLGPVVAGIGAIVTGIGAALPVLAALSALLTGTAIPAVISFGAVMLPILAPIAAIAGAAALVIAAIRHWDEIKAITSRVLGWIGGMVTGIGQWISVKLVGILNGIMKPIRIVGDAFFKLYDRVVGHSYVPDMVDEIGVQMQRLDGEMVKPATKATDAAAQAFSALRDRVRGILAGIFPEQAEVNALQTKLADLDAALAAKMIDPTVWAAARKRLVDQLLDARAAADQAGAGGSIGLDGTTARIPVANADMQKDVEQTSKAVEDALGRIPTKTSDVVKGFAEMARDVAGSLSGFARSIKSGDWLSALSSVLDVIGQISGAIGGGGQAATRTYPIGVPTYGGARAKGGPVLPGRDYLIGEDGPEMLRMGSGGGHIVPNHALMSGPTVVQLLVGEGQLFEPRVAGISGNVAVETVQTGARASALRGRQALA